MIWSQSIFEQGYQTFDILGSSLFFFPGFPSIFSLSSIVVEFDSDYVVNIVPLSIICYHSYTYLRREHHMGTDIENLESKVAPACLSTSGKERNYI